MSNISKTTKFLIIVFIITIITISGYLIFFSFLKEKNEKASGILNVINSSLTDDVFIRNLRNTIAEIEGEQNNLDSYFVLSSQIVKFLEIIEGLEKNTGADIEVKSIEEVDDMNSKLLNHLDLNVIATGDWKSMYHFFILLENMPFKTEINRIQFNKTEIRNEEEVTQSWRGSFNFSVVQINK